VDDLITFLRAQLDEDERIARAATLGPWVQSGIGDYGWTVDFGCPGAGVETADTEQGLADASFIAAHNPARVLRDIDAKRRTLVRCEEEMFSGIPRLVHFAKQTVREMALPFADRPGYERAVASYE
jgi:hypothetical protein